ncbi:MAG: PEP-CTERM sorting domain-containing protein [Acidobacteriota bacterium]|nr:PEP-CTERM sorting domain-containing protein [Acidobacteriota bacterium]
MIKHLVVLSALAIGSIAVAHADTITGGFATGGGSDSFTSSTITFNSGSAVTTGSATGSFAPYLTGGQAINYFPAFPAGTPLPYTQGQNVVPAGLSPLTLFSVTGNNETFSFILQDYNALYTTNTPGCMTAVPSSSATCLSVSGDGYFEGTGAVTFDNTPAAFQFTSQYTTPGQTIGNITSFSASAEAIPSAVPEPASLALFGTGMLGIVGFARRKFNV